MITIKYSFLTNISSLLRTLKAKRWLDEKGYIYTFNFWDLFKIESKRVKRIEKIFQKLESKNKSIVIYLSKFDTYGGYKLPNHVFLNIYQPLNQIKKTFDHEMVHLEVEDEVKKRKLTHEQKEKLVNAKLMKRKKQ